MGWYRIIYTTVYQFRGYHEKEQKKEKEDQIIRFSTANCAESTYEKRRCAREKQNSQANENAARYKKRTPQFFFF